MLVEDNPDEVVIFKLACPKAGLSNPFEVMETATAAMDYLSNPRLPRPCILISDLNMPGANGFELLAWIKERFQNNMFPVVVLTASADERDREKVLALGAAEFLTKPGGFYETVDLLKRLKQKWVDNHCPPPR